MKLLSKLLHALDYNKIIGNTNITISSIQLDSNHVISSSLFVAIKGTYVDGHSFIEDAINSGAISIVCENLPPIQINGVTYISVADTSIALSVLAINFYSNPSKQIKLIGITGTNGKTSTAHYLYSLFTQLNFKVGLISTIENKINKRILPSKHTTPNSIEINRLLSIMVKDECEFCFMEASSHAIHQKRIIGLLLRRYF